MLELISGAIVAAVAVALVLEPLTRRRTAFSQPNPLDDEPIELEESTSPKVQALLALREIEFDRATGKLSDEDYSALKQKYSALVLSAMQIEGGQSDHDEAELAIQRAREHRPTVCKACDRDVEPGAVFCSVCGRSLVSKDSRARCWMCGDELIDDAKFCGGCGFALSA